jgi:hypothetical protein
MQTCLSARLRRIPDVRIAGPQYSACETRRHRGWHRDRNHRSACGQVTVVPPTAAQVGYFDDATPGLSLRLTAKDVRTSSIVPASVSPRFWRSSPVWFRAR